ncbi:MAG: polysaccharide biosynthesis tyrosine autokinase [Terracidiphilus sp.]
MKQPTNPNTEPVPPSFEPTANLSQLPGTATEGNSIGRFIEFLKKRGWMIVAGLALGLAGAVVVNVLMQKKYTATAQIDIGPDMTSQFRLEQVQDLTGGDDAQNLDTEIAILESRTLALETIQALQLEQNEDFLTYPKKHPWNLSEPSARELLEAVFEGDLRVERLGHTSIINVSFTSRKRGLSSLAANTLIDNYIEHSFRENYNATAKVSGWLNSQLTDLKERLEKSQAQMVADQKNLGIVGIDPKDSVLVTNLEELNKQLADAEAERMLKEAQLQALKSASPDVIDAAAGAKDPILQASRVRLNDLQTQYASLTQTYGPSYPEVKTLRVQIRELKGMLEQNERAEVSRVQKEFDAAQNNENMLRSKLEAEEQNAYSKGAQGARFDFARRDYEAARELYDGLQQRLQEAGIIAGLHSTSIHIVDNADIPVYSSHPRKNVNLAIGTGAGLGLGLALALLLEAMDTNLKSMNDVEQSLQLPLLAAIPEVEAEQLAPMRFRAEAVSKGSASWSRIAEALRGMRTSILLSSPGAPPKVVMISSTRPAEGKSSVATLVAITFALNGSRVLLIDADLRRSSIHLRFRIPNAIGLSSILSGKTPYREGITVWPDLPNLHIMTSGPVAPLPSELLGSEQMESLLKELRSEFDFVFIDTPPVLAVTDASILGRLADATILIVRYGTTQRHVVQRCIDLLDRSGTHLVGVAMNAVDFKSPEYSEYYGKKYFEYYGERKGE